MHRMPPALTDGKSAADVRMALPASHGRSMGAMPESGRHGPLRNRCTAPSLTIGASSVPHTKVATIPNARAFGQPGLTKACRT